MDHIALDIETIPLETDPDFDDPSHWTVFAIALGHKTPDSDMVVDVLFRDHAHFDAERDLIERMIDWIAEHTHGKQRRILTYNGESYDLPILKHRATVLDDEIPDSNLAERLYMMLETSLHADLIQDIKQQKGYYVSLDDALDEFSIDADEPEWMGSTVTGADMPSMGLELVSGRANDGLRDTVRRYAASDVEPLFRLYEELQSTKATME